MTTTSTKRSEPVLHDGANGIHGTPKEFARQLTVAAPKALKRASKKTQDMATKHPLAAAGALLGAGAVVGAVVSRVFQRKPTVREVVAASVRSQAKQVAKSVSSARKSLRKAMK